MSAGHPQFECVEQRIGYTFKDKALLTRALTHRSYSTDNNQRLEFLGDAIIGLVLAEMLYQDTRDLEEGEMTRRRAMLICGPVLVEIARDLQLSDHLLLGDSENTDTGRNRPSTLEDAVEAIIGAVYLDGGLRQAREVVARLYGPIEERISDLTESHNPKGRLQEITQAAMRQDVVAYRLVDILGQAPHQEFHVEVSVDGKPMGSGTGRTKKKAEEEAARQALERLGEDS